MKPMKELFREANKMKKMAITIVVIAFLVSVRTKRQG